MKRSSLFALNFLLLVVCPVSSAATGQTRIHPEEIFSDPRFEIIKNRFMRLASGRSMTVRVKVHVSSKIAANELVERYINHYLTVIGAEPFDSSDSQFLLEVKGLSVENNGVIDQDVSIDFFDAQAQGGKRLIMSSRTHLTCDRLPYHTFARPSANCLRDEDSVREAFLRLSNRR